jgi:hypothetical protein
MPEIRIDIPDGRQQFLEVFITRPALLLQGGLAPEVGFGLDDLQGRGGFWTG